MVVYVAVGALIFSMVAQVFWFSAGFIRVICCAPELGS